MVEGAGAVIEGLAREARITRSTHDSLILGFELDDGARSMADIVLGKVPGCAYLCMNTHVYWEFCSETGVPCMPACPTLYYIVQCRVWRWSSLLRHSFACAAAPVMKLPHFCRADPHA